MNFKRDSAIEDIDVNLTPLIDVVFLLLIFFMVSTTFDTTSQLKIQLPQASDTMQQKQSSRLNLMINADGKFFLNSRELRNNKAITLKSALERALKGKKQAILIQSDAKAPVQSMITAMDIVGQLGLSQVSIATTHPIE